MSKIDKIKREEVLPIVKLAIQEDVGVGDITTNSIIPEEKEAKGEIIAEEDCVVAGLPVAEIVFKEIDDQIEFVKKVKDGDKAKAGMVIAEVKGFARGFLTGERLALNFLQRLSGIATLTAKFVSKVANYKTRIMDTRKTSPGNRYLEKYAVRVGGGKNHRMGLYDQFLIKDNHLKIGSGSDRIKKYVEMAREYNPNIQIEVEAENMEEVQEAIDAKVDILLLDNMNVDEIKRTVEFVDGRVIVEASGGITLENVQEIAATGVDCISIGALTTAARAINMKLEFVK